MIVDEIDAKKRILYNRIYSALKEFSQDTGLIVENVYFHSTTCSRIGEPSFTEYFDFESTLKTKLD